MSAKCDASEPGGAKIPRLIPLCSVLVIKSLLVAGICVLCYELSAAMSLLFACEDPATWRSVYDKYWDVVAKVKGPKPGKLLNLDMW